jgi:hypothetical protein
LDELPLKENIMNFKTVTIVKHPINIVWTTMRDDLPKLVDLLEDIESINVELYGKKEDVCKVVNIWKASPRFSRSIATNLDSNIFVWTDHAEWNERKLECHWTIESHYFRDRVHCSGLNKFGSAMGGRGTRVTFSGEFELKDQSLPLASRFLEESISKSIENVLRNVISKNFRKTVEALAKHLDANMDLKTKNDRHITDDLRA